MRGTVRVLGVIVATLAMVAGVAAAAVAQSASASDEKITLDVGTRDDIVSANPFKACCASDYEMLLLNYNMLFGFAAKDLSPVPELAKECNPSEDYMTWTCDIRDDVMWQDGQQLTAEDIAFTYRFTLDNGLSTFSDYLPFNPTFETPDPYTLVWKSEEPTFAPTVPPYVPIIPEHIWGKLDGKPAKEIRSYEQVPVIGSGPFQMTEWEAGEFFKMEAVPGHFFGTPTIDEVVYHIYGNDEAMVQALKSGEIDFAYEVPPTLGKSLEGADDIAVSTQAANYHTNLAFNFGGQDKWHPKVYGSPAVTEPTNNPALHDHAVRLAIAHAIDKQAIADKVFQGYALPADTFIAPDKAYWHLDIPADEEYDFNIDEANQILDDAGYTDRTSDGIRIDPKSGRPLDLDILAISNEQGSVETGQLMEGWMQQIGIKFDVRTVSESKAYEEWENGTFDAYLWDWGGDPDPDFNMSIYITSQCLGWSDGCYSNPELDRLYQEQRQTFDREARRDIVYEFQRDYYEQIPEISVVYPQIISAYRTDAFTGYVPTPTDGGALLFGWRVDSYLNLKPVTAAGTEGGGGGGGSAGIWIAVAAVVVIGIAAAVMMSRRRAEEDEA